MINIPIGDIVSKICQKSGLSETEVRQKIFSKVEQLYGLVSEEGAAHIIANEYGIKLFETSGSLKIKDILMGMKAVDIVGKVVRKYEVREFATEKRKGKVANLMLADETGAIRIVFWNDKTTDFDQIRENDVVKISGAYVRDNAGRKELHLGDNSKIIINPANVVINTRERKEYDRKTVSELAEGMSVEVLGTIVQVFDIRFFEVCPKCNKRMKLKDEALACEEHGAIPPGYNYVMNVYLDDGTGNVRAIFWRLQTQKLLKMQDADIVGLRTSPEGFERFKTDLLGSQIKVLGTVKNNIMGRLELNVDIVFVDLNPDDEIAQLDNAKQIVLETKHEQVAAPAPVAKPAIATKPTSSAGSDDEFEISEDFLE